MAFCMHRRELLATATFASASYILPAPVNAYGLYQTSRTMQAPRQQVGEFIWQWLLLLIDASSSMRKPFDQMSFYDMQVEAMARALIEPCVAERLIGPPGGRTAIGAVLWSANMQQEIAIHWHVIRSIEDIAAVAARLRRAPNYLDSYTGTAAAVRFASELLKAGHLPRSGCRKIINMTANGRDNHGGDPAAAAKQAEESGITINAIVMRGYDGTVEEMYDYYAKNVVTRDGLVFKVESEDEALEALAVANASKFCAEIALAPSSPLT